MNKLILEELQGDVLVDLSRQERVNVVDISQITLSPGKYDFLTYFGRK